MDGDPLSSPLTITQCVTLELNYSNYLSWKFQFEKFLNSQSLLGYVTGDTPRPPPTLTVRNGDQVTETPNPAYVMAWLVGSLSEEAIKTFYGLRSSQELWYYLAQKYNCVSPTWKVDLYSRIQSTKKGSRSLIEYVPLWDKVSLWSAGFHWLSSVRTRENLWCVARSRERIRINIYCHWTLDGHFPMTKLRRRGLQANRFQWEVVFLWVSYWNCSASGFLLKQRRILFTRSWSTPWRLSRQRKLLDSR